MEGCHSCMESNVAGNVIPVAADVVAVVGSLEVEVVEEGQKRRETCMWMEVERQMLEADYCVVALVVAAVLQQDHPGFGAGFEAEFEVEVEVAAAAAVAVAIVAVAVVAVGEDLQSTDYAVKEDIDMADF